MAHAKKTIQRVLDCITAHPGQDAIALKALGAPAVQRGILKEMENLGLITWDGGGWSAVPAKCLCREPKRHRDCMYCGSGYWGEVVCGICKEQGIDGKVIRGTERRVCAKHRAKDSK